METLQMETSLDQWQTTRSREMGVGDLLCLLLRGKRMIAIFCLAGALVSTEVGAVRFRTVPAERFCNSFAGLAADALRSSGCVSAFLECSSPALSSFLP